LVTTLLCCTVPACASLETLRHEGLWSFDVQDEAATAAPALHPYLVQAFWRGETPDYPFDVIGRFTYQVPIWVKDEHIHARLRTEAGKHGANVVVVEHEEIDEVCDECTDYWVLRGVLGRRRD
jgi:hypothetical protein